MNKVAMITGAGRGIGLATAKAFAADGWQVIGIDRPGRENAASETPIWPADLSDPVSIGPLFERLEQEAGRLDALINNAAIQIAKSILDTTLDEWDQVLNINLRAAFLTSRRAHGLLQTAHGAIVNVSSVHAMATSTGLAAYAASKGGLLALTRAMALEFGSDGIRVNVVLPGAVDTQMLRAGLGRGHLVGENQQAMLRALGRRTALGRIGTADEVAQSILFLADPERSSYVTGSALAIDGGALARLSTE